jgi:hypothetical protein
VTTSSPTAWRCSVIHLPTKPLLPVTSTLTARG